MPKVALTPSQEDEVREWCRKGATIEAAHRRAIAAGWRVSLARIGQLAQEARRKPTPAPAPVPADHSTSPGSLSFDREPDLEQRLQRMEQRLAALQELPSETLEQAAIAAVTQCRRLSQDPGVDPRVQVMALDKLDKLIRLAKEIRDANSDTGASLWAPGAEEDT